MNKEQAKEFLQNNRDALILLSDKIRNAELGSETFEQFNARKSARQIVESWISEIFSIAYSEQEFPRDEDNLYRVLDRRHRLGRDDA